jgi:hypothetical protein
LAALVSRERAFAYDTELRDLDVSHWFCLNKPAGTATVADERERNLMKNRNAPGSLPLHVEQLDTTSFLRKVATYDAALKTTRRADLDQKRKKQLLVFENQIVSLSGWLVLAYPGQAESAIATTLRFTTGISRCLRSQVITHRSRVIRPRLFAKSLRVPKGPFTTRVCAFSR